jgi:hypothetical protein
MGNGCLEDGRKRLVETGARDSGAGGGMQRRVWIAGDCILFLIVRKGFSSGPLLFSFCFCPESHPPVWFFALLD